MIIPMIDIIFFLLVFYVMTTLYMTEKQGIAVRLPGASGAAVHAGANVAITVTAGNDVYVGADKVAAAELAATIRRYPRVAETRFTINADMAARHGVVVGVLDALRSVGAVEVSIAVSPPGSGP